MGCQIGVVAHSIVADSTLGVYSHVVRVAIGTFEIPHPTGTRVGTATELLRLHLITIDIQVAVTIAVRIDRLNLARSQLIVTILQMIFWNSRIEELQHVLTFIEIHDVVSNVGDVNFVISRFIIFIIRIVFKLCYSISLQIRQSLCPCRIVVILLHQRTDVFGWQCQSRVIRLSCQQFVIRPVYQVIGDGNVT